MTSTPLVSVVMPFYNDGPTVERAVNSILGQSEKNLELIAVDDASTDDGLARISCITDPRLRILKHDANRGSAAARNTGMRTARGAFIKPMDADDRCYPHHISHCLRKLQENSSWGACGSWARMVGWGPHPFVFRYPCEPAAVRAYWLFGTPFVHSTMLLRTSTIRELGLEYDESRKADDYVFLRRLVHRAPIGNIPRVLVDYFCNPKGQSLTDGAAAWEERYTEMRDELQTVLQRGVSDEELHYHAEVGNGNGAQSREDLGKAELWMRELMEANKQSCIYDPNGLQAASAMVWFRYCRNSSHLGLPALQAWLKSGHGRHYTPTFTEWVAFLGSWMLSRVNPQRRRPQGGMVGA